MPRTDKLGNLCDLRVQVHIRMGTNLSFNVYAAIDNAQRMYGESGISFETPTVSSIALSASDLGRLSVINGECNWDQESAEQKELFDIVGASPFAGVTAIFIGGIQTATGPLNGCAGHATYRAGVLIGSACTPWTLSHEVGHVLLGPKFSPVHTNDPKNIMYERSSTFTQASSPSFNAAQIEQIRRSPYVMDG